MASRNALSIAAGAVLLLAVAWASLSVGSEPVAVGQGLWAWWQGALTPEALIVITDCP